MGSLLRRRPSAAMVVALFALFVATGGSSYAALKIGTKNLKNNSVTSAKIKNGTIGSRDINSKARRTLKGQKGDPGAKGATGNSGAKGDKGDPGSAVAYARVRKSGITGGDTVTDNLSNNVADSNVTHPLTGLYCFTGLGFTPQNAVATVDYATSGNNEFAQVVFPGTEFFPGSCGSSQLAVVVFNTSSAFTDAGLYVSIN